MEPLDYLVIRIANELFRQNAEILHKELGRPSSESITLRKVCGPVAVAFLQEIVPLVSTLRYDIDIRREAYVYELKRWGKMLREVFRNHLPTTDYTVDFHPASDLSYVWAAVTEECVDTYMDSIELQLWAAP